MAREKIDSLTSLRFFAAAAIVAYHARGHFGLPTDFLAPFELSQGVAFFFVLSGFILAFVYPDLEQNGARGKFWLARFARVWPLHLATLLLYVALLPELVKFDPGRLPANLLLVQAWIPNQSWFFSFNSVSWSISTEAFFYLSFPYLIKNFERTWPVKLAGSFLLVLIMASLGNGLHLPVWSDSGFSIHGLMYINPLSRVFEFVLGMTLALFYRKYAVKRDAPLLVGFGCEAFALLLLYVLTHYTVKISTSLARLPFVQEGGKMWLQHAGVPVLSFALLIFVMAWGRGPLARVLRARPFVFLGEISFAGYLLHRLLLHYYWDHFAPEQGPLPMAIYLAFLLTLSFVLWSVVEVPFRQIIVKGPSALPRPSRTAQLASACAFVALFAGFIGIWSGAPLKTVAQYTQSPTEDCDIAYGDELKLIGCQAVAQNDGTHIHLTWQALKKQKIANYVAVQLLSDNNVLVRLKNYRQSQREEVVEKGAVFENDFLVPEDEMQYVRAVAFGLSRPLGDAPRARQQGRSPDDSFDPLSSNIGLYRGMVAMPLAPRPDASVAGRVNKPVL
ncbi:MAG: acyltransferase [Cyanobacteria bacterium SZAS TMP-1]|nr:acyltransferase [Cyanobacteria bacterium SZAS TMP-1]